MKVFRNSREKQGFSLIEMLIVLSVVGLLFAMSAPQFFTLMQSTSLTTEGAFLRNKLTQAQQIALSKNADVEVRFFKFKDEAQVETVEQFRGIQFYTYNQRGEAEPISQFFKLKAPIVVSSDNKMSTVLRPTSDDFYSPRRGRSEIPIEGVRREAEFVSFRFRPDGSTDLPGKAGSDTWHLTLVKETDGSNGSVPDNFYTVQIDPFNGRLLEFRP